jgi:hypothetical protein
MDGKQKTPNPKRPSKELLTQLHALKESKGKIAVIEPDSGDYFLGDTLTEGLKEARKKYPGKIFYSIRIGFDYMCEFKGTLKQKSTVVQTV